MVLTLLKITVILYGVSVWVCLLLPSNLTQIICLCQEYHRSIACVLSHSMTSVCPVTDNVHLGHLIEVRLLFFAVTIFSLVFSFGINAFVWRHIKTM